MILVEVNIYFCLIEVEVWDAGNIIKTIIHSSRIEKAKEAITLFLKSLPSESIFNIISYGSDYKNMFPKSVKAIKENI